MEVGGSVAPAADVRPADARQRLDGGGDDHEQAAHFGRAVGGRLVGQVGKVGVVTRFDEEGDRPGGLGRGGDQPGLVAPHDAGLPVVEFVVRAGAPAVGGILRRSRLVGVE